VSSKDKRSLANNLLNEELQKEKLAAENKQKKRNKERAQRMRAEKTLRQR
jgi:hypothetical protein